MLQPAGAATESAEMLKGTQAMLLNSCVCLSGQLLPCFWGLTWLFFGTLWCLQNMSLPFQPPLAVAAIGSGAARCAMAGPAHPALDVALVIPPECMFK